MTQSDQPIGAYAVIQWLDSNEEGDGYYFSFGEYNEDNDPDHDSFGVRDDDIFFYCDGEHELKSYLTKGSEDFVVIAYDLAYKE